MPLNSNFYFYLVHISLVYELQNNNKAVMAFFFFFFFPSNYRNIEITLLINNCNSMASFLAHQSHYPKMLSGHYTKPIYVHKWSFLHTTVFLYTSTSNVWKYLSAAWDNSKKDRKSVV